VDVCQHPRHLHEGPEKLIDLSTQSSLLHCLRHLGFGGTKTSIRAWLSLLSIPIRHHHRCLFTTPLLAMATMASEVKGQVHQYPNRPERRRIHPPSHGYQLFLVVRGRVHLSILDQAEELFVVVEVQLRYKRRTGLWHCILLHLYLLHSPVSKRRCFTEMVGQRSVDEHRRLQPVIIYRRTSSTDMTPPLDFLQAASFSHPFLASHRCVIWCLDLSSSLVLPF